MPLNPAIWSQGMFDLITKPRLLDEIMGRTPEGKVKVQIKQLLASYAPIYVNCPVPGGYGEPMLDFVCCYRGHFFMIETKADGKELKPRQELCSEQVHEAGGKVFVVTGPTGDPTAWMGYLELVTWLNEIRDSQ